MDPEILAMFLEAQNKDRIKVPPAPTQKRKSEFDQNEGLRYSMIVFGAKSAKKNVFNAGPGFDLNWEQIEVAEQSDSNKKTTYQSNITNRKNIVYDKNVKKPVDEQLCISHTDLKGIQHTETIKFVQNSCTNVEYYKFKNCVFLTFGTPKSNDKEPHTIQVLSFSEKHVEKAEKLWSELQEKRTKWFPRTKFYRPSTDLCLSRVGLLYSWKKVVGIYRLFSEFYDRVGMRGYPVEGPNHALIDIYEQFVKNYSDSGKYGTCGLKELESGAAEGEDSLKKFEPSTSQEWTDVEGDSDEAENTENDTENKENIELNKVSDEKVNKSKEAGSETAACSQTKNNEHEKSPKTALEIAPEPEKITKVLLAETLLMPFQVLVKDLKEEGPYNCMDESGSDPPVKIASHSVKRVTCEKIDSSKFSVTFIDSENIANQIIIGPNHFDSITLLKFPYVPFDKLSADGEVFTVVIGSTTAGVINHYMFMEYTDDPYDDCDYGSEEGDTFGAMHGFNLSQDIFRFSRDHLEKAAYQKIDFDEMVCMRPCSGHDKIGNDEYLENFKRKFEEIKKRTAWGFLSKMNRVIFDVVPMDYYPGFEVVPMSEFASGGVKDLN